METNKNTLQPKNMKAVYHAAGQLYKKIMDEDISVERGSAAVMVLNAQIKIFIGECKLAQVRNAPDIRHFELFDPDEQNDLSSKLNPNSEIKS